MNLPLIIAVLIDTQSLLHISMQIGDIMPVLSAVGTASPEHILEQNEVKTFARAMFGATLPNIDRLVQAYDNAQIQRRHFCVPLDWFGQDHTFREKNDLYISNACALSEEAIRQCLERAECQFEDVDYLLYVSTTGLSTPSIDALLIQDLPFRKDIKRLPIWGLGCAGGAASISRGMEIARAVPSARVLVVVTELCGLTFMPNDLSKANLIASALFGDGSAAVLIEGEECTPRRITSPGIIDSSTRTLPDSLDVMGWDISEAGFGIQISRDIPTIVRTFMRDSIAELLGRHDLRKEQIRHFITHPGGAKVLEAYQESLELPRSTFQDTWEVLNNYGNMSAASVLFVLERFMEKISAERKEGNPVDREYGLLGALGPGFSSEVVLLQWEEQPSISR